MKILAFVFLGGGLGSVARYLVSAYTNNLWSIGKSPLGTFIVNMLGCLLIGLFSHYFTKNPSDYKFFLVAGFCGGYTTFSTLSLEVYQLWSENHILTLLIYVLMSLLVGVLMVFIGHNLVKM